MLIVLPPHNARMIKEMEESSLKDYNMLSDITISQKADAKFIATGIIIENQVMRDGTHAYADSAERLNKFYSEIPEKFNTVWYRGQDTIWSEDPYFVWLSNKKWPLYEEFNMHLLHYQQVFYL